MLVLKNLYGFMLLYCHNKKCVTTSRFTILCYAQAQYKFIVFEATTKLQSFATLIFQDVKKSAQSGNIFDNFQTFLYPHIYVFLHVIWNYRCPVKLTNAVSRWLKSGKVSIPARYEIFDFSWNDCLASDIVKNQSVQIGLILKMYYVNGPLGVNVIL